jgi:hypothetical protein
VKKIILIIIIIINFASKSGEKKGLTPHTHTPRGAG